MNKFVEELKYDLLKRVRMGQGLKKVNEWVSIDCRLLTIWQDDDNGLIEIRYVENDGETPKLTAMVLNHKGEMDASDLDSALEHTAELIESTTEVYLNTFPDRKLDWDWLGN